MIVTRRIECYIIAEKEQWTENWKTLRYIDNNLYRMANEIMNGQYFNDVLEERLIIHHPNYKEAKKDAISKEYSKLNIIKKEVALQAKEIFQQSKRNTTYQLISTLFPDISSYIRSALNIKVDKNYNEFKLQLKRGERSLPTYKKGLPIPFTPAPKFEILEDKITFIFPGKITFALKFGRDRSNNKSIIDKIISGEYKACDSSIQIKENKIFLLLAVNIGESNRVLDKNICVGVDLGINIPVYVSLNEGFGRQAVGKREEFLNVRTRIAKERKQIQKSLKATSGGRGQKEKLQALEHIKEKERNFVHGQNHIFSKEIINFALQNNAGVIKLEKLTGIGKDRTNNWILRNWSYFELQSMIEYKAKMNNIEVRYVDPYHTSQDCSFCGHWEKDQRLDQQTFLCKNPECSNKNEKGENETVNADWNASQNIAKSENYVSRSSDSKTKNSKEKTELAVQL